MRGVYSASLEEAGKPVHRLFQPLDDLIEQRGEIQFDPYEAMKSVLRFRK